MCELMGCFRASSDAFSHSQNGFCLLEHIRVFSVPLLQVQSSHGTSDLEMAVYIETYFSFACMAWL